MQRDLCPDFQCPEDDTSLLHAKQTPVGENIKNLAQLIALTFLSCLIKEECLTVQMKPWTKETNVGTKSILNDCQ